ncbi:MAG: NFACT family protein [Defluviitaleaceae bacterium]|nr:NFACT family protein [Defluviitaleaceae bacterium]
MAFDGCVTKATVQELQKALLTGRITKIYQLSKYEMLFTIRQQRQNKKVLFSVHPTYARIQLTHLDYAHANEPPMFCMLMRKHLEGTIVTDIEQVNHDRIIKWTLTQRDEFGGDVTKYLYLEVMNKHSNFILTTKEGKIIDCIKHVPPLMNRHRTLQPSATYVLPPETQKIDPHEATLAHFESFVKDVDTTLAAGIMRTFNGLSKQIANEIVYRAASEAPEALLTMFQTVMAEIRDDPKPSIMSGDKEQFYLIPLTHLKSDVKSYDSVATLLDAFYFGKETKDRIKDHFSNIEMLVKQWLSKNVKKLEKLAIELVNTEKADDYRLKGELILANAYRLNRGDQILITQNFYDENLAEIKIALDPLLTPSDNAQKYFKRYNKAKAAVSHLNVQIEVAEREIDYFEGLMTYLVSADIQDVYEIQEELRTRGYLKKRHEKKIKKRTLPHVDRYETENGIELVVGKNNLQNDYVTHKLGKRHEWWFHAKEMPGSHVLVRSSVDPLEETEIRAAANLAAYFSKGRDSSSVAIDYTQIRNLKKVPGTALGFVTYDTCKTIYIDPAYEDVMKLTKLKRQ